MSQLVGKRSSLLSFLRKAKRSLTTPSSTINQVPGTDVLVAGNTSADIDSIVSAVIYSYFSTRPGRNYTPIINLPDVSSGRDLYRLRLEFFEALRFSLETTDEQVNNHNPEAHVVEEYLTTTANLRDLIEKRTGKFRPEDKKQHLDLMLVDWNSLPQTHGNSHGLSGLSDVFRDDLEISIVGCIDHRVDESFVPPLEDLPGHDPRCIQTPVGSCTSLVVRELRSRGLWSQNHDKDPETVLFQAQAAKLALSAILIDTANMTNEHAVSNVDVEAVSFLENDINACVSSGGCIQWKRDAFYEAIHKAKITSLDRLTMQEILGRDYKEWADTIPCDEGTVRLGICSIARPTAWLLKMSNFKGDESPSFLDELNAFAANRELDAVAVMTSFRDANNQHSRELILHVLNEKCGNEAQLFGSLYKDTLDLNTWKKRTAGEEGEPILYNCSEGEVFASKNSLKDQKFVYQRIWQQQNTAQSRKQVAPLMRDIFSKRISRT